MTSVDCAYWCGCGYATCVAWSCVDTQTVEISAALGNEYDGVSSGRVHVSVTISYITTGASTAEKQGSRSVLGDTCGLREGGSVSN